MFGGGNSNISTEDIEDGFFKVRVISLLQLGTGLLGFACGVVALVYAWPNREVPLSVGAGVWVSIMVSIKRNGLGRAKVLNSCLSPGLNAFIQFSLNIFYLFKRTVLGGLIHTFSLLQVIASATCGLAATCMLISLYNQHIKRLVNNFFLLLFFSFFSLPVIPLLLLCISLYNQHIKRVVSIFFFLLFSSLSLFSFFSSSFFSFFSSSSCTSNQTLEEPTI